MKLSVCGRTDQGRRRLKNEDDLAMVDLTTKREIAAPIEEEGVAVGACGILLAVSDGVGGKKAGEIASSLALETLSHEMEALASGCPRRAVFKVAIENVNKRVWQEAQNEPRLHGMATTLTGAVVCHNRAIIAHVGDSRVYFLRGRSIQQLTRDQSYCAALVANGTLTEMQAEESPFRSIILQAVGREPTVDVALDAVDVENGDMLLLCTDGLSNKVTAEEMAEALRSLPLADAVQKLIDLANERGGEDNITVTVASVRS